MLNSLKSLNNYQLDTLDTDSEMGKVKDVYFDDHFWKMRYLVVETGSWLNKRKVLISTHAIDAIDRKKELIIINLTKSQIENSPPLDTEKPVSRQYQLQLSEYYDQPVYWGDVQSAGLGSKFNQLVMTPIITEDNLRADYVQDKDGDPNLRSSNYVRGYHLQTIDDQIGHVDDFLFDEETLTLEYLLVDTDRWFTDKKVLLLTSWIENIQWDRSIVEVNFSAEKIKKAPAYGGSTVISKADEKALHEYFDR